MVTITPKKVGIREVFGLSEALRLSIPELKIRSIELLLTYNSRRGQGEIIIAGRGIRYVLDVPHTPESRAVALREALSVYKHTLLERQRGLTVNVGSRDRFSQLEVDVFYQQL